LFPLLLALAVHIAAGRSPSPPPCGPLLRPCPRWEESRCWKDRRSPRST